MKSGGENREVAQQKKKQLCVGLEGSQTELQVGEPFYTFTVSNIAKIDP